MAIATVDELVAPGAPPRAQRRRAGAADSDPDSRASNVERDRPRTFDTPLTDLRPRDNSTSAAEGRRPRHDDLIVCAYQWPLHYQG